MARRFEQQGSRSLELKTGNIRTRARQLVLFENVMLRERGQKLTQPQNFSPWKLQGA